MALLGIDLGGTKLGIAVFTEDGNLLHKEIIFLHSRKGPEIGKLIARQISGRLRADHREHPAIQSIGRTIQRAKPYRIEAGKGGGEGTAMNVTVGIASRRTIVLTGTIGIRSIRGAARDTEGGAQGVGFPKAKGTPSGSLNGNHLDKDT